MVTPLGQFAFASGYSDTWQERSECPLTYGNRSLCQWCNTFVQTCLVVCMEKAQLYEIEFGSSRLISVSYDRFISPTARNMPLRFADRQNLMLYKRCAPDWGGQTPRLHYGRHEVWCQGDYRKRKWREEMVARHSQFKHSLCIYSDFHRKIIQLLSWVFYNIKTICPLHTDSHYENKTITRLSYLYDRDSILLSQCLWGGPLSM